MRSWPIAAGTTITLRDGAKVLVRPIAPSDRTALAEGYARLSERSRYRRFFTPTSELDDATLTALTDVDHHDEEALVALDPASGQGLGVARWFRSATDRGAAEVAVTVADDWQGRGLGRALLEQLADRARDEGIERFTALVLAENRGALALLSGLGPTARRAGGPEVELVIELPERPGLGDNLARALRGAAAGTIAAAETLAQRLRPARVRRPVPAVGPWRTIVVGTDGSETAGHAVAAAVELAGRLGAGLHVVGAHLPLEPAERADRAVAGAAATARARGIVPRAHVLRREPARALLDVAEEVGADLLVVGSVGMTGAARHILGSVPDAVSHRAPCHVLIVRTA